MGAISFSLDPLLLDELLRLMPLPLFVETGTFRGESLDLASPRFAQCISIELAHEHYAAARTKFATQPHVELIQGDSPAVLAGLRPRLAATPALFWLDAHWCAAANTAGARSACPLVAELHAIGRLLPDSVIMIDDARLFLGPPPQPHEISNWPDLDEVLQALRQASSEHALVYFNDVLLYLPRARLPDIRPYLHRHSINLLTYADKARAYDNLLLQAQTKDAEVQQLAAASKERELALAQSHAEADRLRANAAQLSAGLQAVHAEMQQLAATSKERELALAQSHAEADRLRANAAQLSASLQAAHAEMQQLAATSKERELALIQSSVEAKTLRAHAAQRLQLNEELVAKLIQSEANAAHAREQTRPFREELAAKEAVIQDLLRTCDERLRLINRFAFRGEQPVGAATRVAAYHASSFLGRARRTLAKRFNAWMLKQSVHRIGALVQYPPRPMQPERFPRRRALAAWPRICLITPSYNQAAFLERTMHSVLDQQYPNLAYGVQDGGSTDASATIITSHIQQLTHAESAKDDGQADAIQKGFKKLYPGPNDIMAWLNSDDRLMPGTLDYVGRYFAGHPEVDVIYGHRVVIDENDREIGRWFMPRHHADTLPWFDLVPQETLFWRSRCFEQIGGMDPSYHFAMDWDLLLRFEQAGLNIRRVPYFLGCFRVHTEQKTSTRILTLGEEEMQRLRRRTHQREVAHWEIHLQLDAETGRSAFVAWLHQLGLRW